MPLLEGRQVQGLRCGAAVWQVHAIETKGNGIALQFEHPTIAGTAVGGWMNRADKIPIVSRPVLSLPVPTAAAICRQGPDDMPYISSSICSSACGSIAACQHQFCWRSQLSCVTSCERQGMYHAIVRTDSKLR